jgi:hypothetical protein
MTALPLTGTLTSENTTTPAFSFTGSVCVLIESGEGEVQIQRSLRNSDFKVLTDTQGNKALYNVQDDVALNAEIANSSSSVSYRLEALNVESPISYTICK